MWSTAGAMTESQFISTVIQEEAGGDWLRFLDASPNGVLLINDDGTIRFSNLSACRLFGYSLEELQGEPVEVLIPERFREGHVGIRNQYLADPQPRHPGRVLTGRRRSGREFPVDLTLTPVTLGDTRCIACNVVDLTERIQADQALSESESRLRDILDNTSAVIYLKLPDGTYVFVNAQFEKLFGVNRNSLTGLTDMQIFPEEMAKVFRENDLRVLESGQILKIDEVAPAADGPHTYVSVKFPLRQSDGKVYAVAGISTDITDRVRAEREIGRLKNRLELILQAISDGIVGVDESGEVTFINNAAREMLGCRDADPTAHVLWNLRELCSTTIRPPVRVDGDPVSTGQGSGVVVGCDGASRPVEYRVTSIQEQELNIGRVYTLRDVADKKARLALEHEVASARAVQQALLPRQPPTIPGFNVAGKVYPASALCGDYLDFVSLSDGRHAFVVGDVSGHGFGPAVQMVETRAYLRALLRIERSPATVLRQLNGLLFPDAVEGSFVTLFLAILDTADGALTYAAAGHEGWLFHGDGREVRLRSTGLPLGMVDDADYEERNVARLSAGDIFVLMTDGVFETLAPGGTIFGWQRTAQFIRDHRGLPAQELIERIHLATREYAQSHVCKDDLTLAVIKAL